MGCAVLLFVGCAGGRSEAPEEQGHTEATEREARSPQSTTEEARCNQTRTYRIKGLYGVFTTNDIPGCPKGGLLSGTDKKDKKDWLDGKDGDDEIHGLGGVDDINGGAGNDVIYGGPGSDYLGDSWGEDVLYGGKGNDALAGVDDFGPPMRDELYCGPGKDVYDARKLDYVDSSCEKKVQLVVGL
jgi:hypothetical protein